MPAIGRGDGVDSVLSAHGGPGKGCPSPTGTSTDVCSGDVFVNGIGVVRKGDPVASHTALGCGSEAPGLTTHSPNVYANGKQIGRFGDDYIGDGSNTITSGSPNVFAN
jgi:uncharacterized Zn-binding protein involved in type VI secretion